LRSFLQSWLAFVLYNFRARLASALRAAYVLRGFVYPLYLWNFTFELWFFIWITGALLLLRNNRRSWCFVTALCWFQASTFLCFLSKWFAIQILLECAVGVVIEEGKSFWKLFRFLFILVLTFWLVIIKVQIYFYWRLCTFQAYVHRLFRRLMRDNREKVRWSSRTSDWNLVSLLKVTSIYFVKIIGVQSKVAVLWVLLYQKCISLFIFYFPRSLTSKFWHLSRW